MLLSEENTHITVLAPFQNKKITFSNIIPLIEKVLAKNYNDTFSTKPSDHYLTMQWEVHCYRRAQRGSDDGEQVVS